MRDPRRFQSPGKQPGEFESVSAQMERAKPLIVRSYEAS